jgi:hypothetical protein
MRERDQRGEAHAAAVVDLLTVDEYRRAIHRACDTASVPRWSRHRLRHSAGTRIAKEAGIEAARAALGHADVATSRRYAIGADVEVAKGIAEKLGWHLLREGRRVAPAAASQPSATAPSLLLKRTDKDGHDVGQNQRGCPACGLGVRIVGCTRPDAAGNGRPEESLARPPILKLNQTSQRLRWRTS